MKMKGLDSGDWLMIAFLFNLVNPGLIPLWFWIWLWVQFFFELRKALRGE
jgi:hypothetical protein